MPKDDDLRASITSAFNLSNRDSYVYHAIASVTLSEVQEAIENGNENGLHAWYLDAEGKAVQFSLQDSPTYVAAANCLLK